VLKKVAYHAVICAAITLLGMPIGAATLHYEGYVAGARVGTATVNVSIAQAGYRVWGSAAADGVANWFSDWHSDFSASGGLVDGAPQLVAYSYNQRDRDSIRDVHVADGKVSYKKNQRPVRKTRAFPTPDLVSALFVKPRCLETWWVNTGRRNYRLERRVGAPGVCRYEVFDRHEKSFKIDLVLAERDGITVPVSLTVHALLRARLILVDEAPKL